MTILKNPLFVRLFIANFASQLGTVVGNMAFAFYLLDRFSTKPYYTTLAELMYALPTLVVFLFVGVLADRLDRKRIAANCDWIRAGLTALLLVTLHYQFIVAAFAVLFLRSAVSKFFSPAEAGLLQGIMEKDLYTQAAGLNQTVMGLFMLFGMGLGSLTYHYLGIEGAVLIDGISFLLSGALIASCRFATEVRMPNGQTSLRGLRFRQVTADFAEGYRYIRRSRLLLALVMGFVLFGFVNGVFSVLPIFTMKYKLSPAHYQKYSALITIFLGIGFLVGSTLGSFLIQKLNRVIVLVGGLLLTGMLSVVLGITSEMWMYLSLVLLTGAIIAPVNIVIGGWIPELVDPSNMGRVNAWNDPLLMLGQSLSLAIVAIVFPNLINVDVLYMVVGMIIFVVSVFYGVTLPTLSRKQPEIHVNS
ncbi:MFS transporter [Alicyclobacillus macrosporangiidus]|uniref:Predicted arabinose efflux permease, MFS family n=1 Tax=Alicyclobacillus macrosporangiidus TaxID=392015 RepID=A0A1I7JBV0_9BACL|nr:MFS transporter [Alicyclobacillus macrosporangiidus]SFU82642.1 Predicted arabinose efflux permease, MFS family [Alicyclobacillus macrosporangiidus]